MAKDEAKAKRRKLTQYVVIAFVIVGIVLVVAELATNVSFEMEVRTRQEALIEEISKPTPRPTLTEKELRDSLKAPVSEEGE